MGAAVLPTPLGRLAVTSDGRALLTAAFLDAGEDAPPDDPDAVVRDATAQLTAWFAGDLRVFTVPLAPRGTTFQRDVWRLVAAIPYGATATYAELAGWVGRPSATRAVAAAIGKNPLAVVVPCHRVIGARGDLRGYAWGLDRKRALLRHEFGGAP